MILFKKIRIIKIHKIKPTLDKNNNNNNKNKLRYFCFVEKL